MLNIQVTILLVAYVLTIMFRNLPNRIVLYNFLYKHTRFAWAGGTFVPVVLLCRVSFLFWQEICFGVHTHVLKVQYSCGVVLVFLVAVGNSFWCYVHA